MRLLILDYQGTLTTLPDPVQFLRELKQEPLTFVAIYSGTSRDEVEARHPGLTALADAFWIKPTFLPKVLDTVVFDQVIVVDDDPLIRRTVARVLSVYEVPVNVQDEKFLSSLLKG